MASKTPDELIQAFETGDVPTQSDYQDIFDSFLNNAQTSAQTIPSQVSFSEDVIVSGLAQAGSMNAVAVSCSTLEISVGEYTASTRSVLPYQMTVVSSVQASTQNIVALPDKKGAEFTVINRASIGIQVFPVSGGEIDSLGTDTAQPVSAGLSQKFICAGVVSGQTKFFTV